jgi:predicted  nucleic acid-binding Zn-ribbon protein
VKADPFVQLRLLDLQSLDSALARLGHRRKTLPELAEMTRLDGLVDALRDGIVRAETEESDLEDGELEVMEKAETAQASLDELTAQRTEHLQARAEAEARRDAAFVEIDAELEKTAAERAELAATLPADLLALYDKIRAAEGGVGAGEISRGRCGGCRLDLMNNEKSEIRAAAPDEVLRHEECGRIMVRTAESGL